MKYRRLHPLALLALALLAALAVTCSDEAQIDAPDVPDDPDDPDTTASAAILVDHSVTAELALIPDAILDEVRDSLVIYYGHTSHGSQLITGLSLLTGENSKYAGPSIEEFGDDLGGSGDTTWAALMRYHLNLNPAINVMMWSWCGGVSDNTEQGINAYLAAMSDLEADYPNVRFVYMTGHLDGTGVDGNLYTRNNQIRAYCNAHDKILFDFADIESYDPDGNYYPDETDACAWCATWCEQHTCIPCDGCAHSHCFNCYQKGKAFWWMMARMVGWEA